jgi:hypothetical protein
MESEGRCNQQHAPCQTETLKMTRNCSRVTNLRLMYSYIFSPFDAHSIFCFFSLGWSELSRLERTEGQETILVLVLVFSSSSPPSSRLVDAAGLNDTRHGKAGLNQACKPLRTQKFNPHPPLPHARPCAAAPNLSCQSNADSKSFESSTEGPGPVTPTSTGTC